MLRKNRIKFTILVAIIFGAMGYLLWSGMEKSAVFYLTLEELDVRKTQMSGDGIRLAGLVREGSVHGSALDGGIIFTMTDGVRTMDVRYSGQIPDTFKAGSSVVIEGVYRGKPVFEATTLLAKCPSKYEPAGVVGSPIRGATGDVP